MSVMKPVRYRKPVRECGYTRYDEYGVSRLGASLMLTQNLFAPERVEHTHFILWFDFKTTGKYTMCVDRDAREVFILKGHRSPTGRPNREPRSRPQTAGSS